MSPRRNALGRGLGALISNPATAKQTPIGVASGSNPAAIEASGNSSSMPNLAATGAVEIEIALIDPNPDQPRREFEPESLRRLADSIRQHGVLQPVVLRRAGSRYELIMGERRFRASQLAERKTLPAVLSDVAAADRLELAIVENVQRKDLNPMELAHAYQALAHAGHSQAEIGQKVAMDRSSVANHLRLLDLSRPIQGDVESGRLTIGHAKALLQVADLAAREGLRERILAQSLSVRAAEQAAREINDAGDSSASGAKATKSARPPALVADPDTRAFIERLERHLQTRVALHPAGKGGGKLEIAFFNPEDLERIGDLLLGETQ
ncbi:MAG: ParB/RepB/Spo0J family partition protein [Myxococcota bacterium]